MADQFPDHVGKVDLISDSENIKKLLAIPFADKAVSMVIHRVGRTLLIDDFDISSYVFREESQQWSWLRNFLCEHVLMDSSGSKSILTKKDATRDNLQSLSMFNKFLHHSVMSADAESPGADMSSTASGPLASARSEGDLNCAAAPNGAERSPVSEKDSKDLTWVTPTKNRPPSKSSRDPRLGSLELSPDFVARQLDRIDDSYGAYSSRYNSEEEGSGATSNYLRNLLWKFEDINMLVGSNLPIFGDANHPAVSLRLRDMKRPINVLTGLDYWLDNLMCSVPEVGLCYHLDGIVQKYELIKTEDIPCISSPHFNPSAVRNIAQNILSFLKSKATKSGHTYWLFKGKHDDVVKLYDLSSLMDNESYGEPTDSNPYLIPVAMLLYRVAKNLKESTLTKSEARENTGYKLLENCLQILKKDTTKYHRIEQVAINSHFLIADILIPVELTTLKGACSNYPAPSDSSQSYKDNFPFNESTFEFDDDCGGEDSSNSDSDDEAVSALAIDKLRDLPESEPYCDSSQKKEGSSGSSKKKSSSRKSSEKLPLKSKDWAERVTEALEHVLSGLETLRARQNIQADESLSPKKQTSTQQPKEEVQKMARSFEPIPMDFRPLNSKDEEEAEKPFVGVGKTKMKKESGQECSLVPLPEVQLSWTQSQQILFFEKAAQLFFLLGEKSLATEKDQEKSVRFLKMGLNCVRAVKRMSPPPIDLSGRPVTKWCALLLALSGDVHLSALSSASPETRTGEDDEVLVQRLSALMDSVRMTREMTTSSLDEGEEDEFSWATAPKFIFEKFGEERLKHSSRCFEEANGLLKHQAHCPAILLKFGNICNELGCLYMNQAMGAFTEAPNTDGDLYARLEALTKKSLSCLVKGIQAFDAIGDSVNCGLLYSNTGKLMRICAHVFSPVNKDKERCKEVSPKEKHFYSKSVHYYELAYQKLAQVKEKAHRIPNFAGLWDSLNWDLSTTLFTYGCLLQDYAPLNRYAYEAVEADITNNFSRALKLCEKFIEDKARPKVQDEDHRLVLYKYRVANIKQRLGSLYHHSFRNMEEEAAKRKQVFQMSDEYYAGAQDIYSSLVSAEKDFIESVLERIGIHEHMLSSLTGFSSRLRALEAILKIMSSVAQFCTASGAGDIATASEDVDSGETLEDMSKLFKVLLQRLSICIQNLMKNLGSKGTKYRKNIEELKALDSSIGTTMTQHDSGSNTISNKKRKQTKSDTLKALQADFCRFCNVCVVKFQSVNST